MKFLFAILLIPLLIIPTAFAESQVVSTDKGALDVKLTYDPIEPNVQSKINIDFLKPGTEDIQVPCGLRYHHLKRWRNCVCNRSINTYFRRFVEDSS